CARPPYKIAGLW
nr:immunoglobulin heavy chain junction region [Macaca mulatta]MOV53840.1 immunoglobulin heavy chain junction region [Macaca mulatta]MOV53964.1 immunoglobulin heavy chain junction region [Macaca mulatta]MOV55786.1 immunoglobulin heavy chain junction region [Macaca mulatta]MOV55818.1 immunoglobulin heavy chain junction region [Macaca mulatta]